jgi:phosphatidylglycerophosphate synthase
MPTRFQRIFPFFLLWSRLGLAPLVPLVGLALPMPLSGRILSGLMAWALVSDIFDGMLARRWGVSTVAMRRWDSTVDTVFWLAMLATLAVAHPAFFKDHAWGLGAVLVLEAATYLTSWARFGQEPATHSLGAKLWTLFFFAFLVEIALTGRADLLWWPCFLGAVTVRLEVLAILLALRTWASDVPHMGAALRLRRGEAISRNRFLNG